MKIPVEKNKEYLVTIESVSSDGNGIAHIDGYAIFVPNTAAGEIVRIKIVKTKSAYGYGKLTEILTPSPNRVIPLCQKSLQCGGCTLSHLNYNTQLELKKEFVNNAFSRIGGFADFKVSEIIGMDKPTRYRNKMVFPIGMNKNDICYGFYRERSHDIVPLDDCLLGDEINIKILNLIKIYMKNQNIKPYNETTHSGTIRRIFIRKSNYTKEIMVVISSNSRTLPQPDLLTKSLCSLSKRIVSVILNINTQKNNLVLGNENIILYGKSVITDRLCGLEYEISPHSFFQVNPSQTEILYKKAIEFADISLSDIVMDIYCGIGTISLYSAKFSKKTIGIEIVAQAIEDARKNAERNNIHNVEFYSADAHIIVPELINNGTKPDIVILDPPRKGSDNSTLAAIALARPEKIVYISCNPATLARDMKFLAENGFLPQKAVAVDMFPFTIHVETITLLQRQDM